MYTYKIKENNIVEIFMNDSNIPCIVQEAYPDGTAFETYQAAEAWVVGLIESAQASESSRRLEINQKRLDAMIAYSLNFDGNVPARLSQEIEALQSEINGLAE